MDSNLNQSTKPIRMLNKFKKKSEATEKSFIFTQLFIYSKKIKVEKDN